MLIDLHSNMELELIVICRMKVTLSSVTSRCVSHIHDPLDGILMLHFVQSAQATHHRQEG